MKLDHHKRKFRAGPIIFQISMGLGVSRGEHGRPYILTSLTTARVVEILNTQWDFLRFSRVNKNYMRFERFSGNWRFETSFIRPIKIVG